jgi:hypothetical protein
VRGGSGVHTHTQWYMTCTPKLVVFLKFIKIKTVNVLKKDPRHTLTTVLLISTTTIAIIFVQPHT